jgi:5-methylcytosine-specific restriction endonuclease McrA
MEDKTAVPAAVCSALSSGQAAVATDILRSSYPFVPLSNAGRRYSVRQMFNIFARDGFIDRYSGARLVHPATLRLISKRLPEQFPFQSNWRADARHFAYWELSPTIDHLVPVSRGGADNESDWVTTSMARNQAKANFTLDELGWSLHEPGRAEYWDGLTGWFIAQANADPTIKSEPYFRDWLAAATR